MIKLIAIIVGGLFALSGLLTDIAIIVLLHLVRRGANLTLGYNEDEDRR